MIENSTNLTVRQLEELCWIHVGAQKCCDKILYDEYMSVPVPRYTKTVTDCSIEYTEDINIDIDNVELLKLQATGHYNYCLGNYYYVEEKKNEGDTNVLE